MDAKLADNQQRWLDLFYIFFDGVMGLAIQQFRFYLDAKIFCDGQCDCQMAFIDFCQPRVDDFFVQLFLLLELEHLARFFGQHASDAVKRNIVIIGVKGGNHLDRNLPVFTQRKGGEQAPVRFGGTVHCGDNRAFLDRAPLLLDDQRINIRTPCHPSAYRA